MHRMNWYYRPWPKVLFLFGAEISFLNQENHHWLKIDKRYLLIQPQMRVIFLVILFKRMWRISGMVAFLFELHDVAAEPFFHIFYSCDASGSVDIVGWKYHTWQGNLFGLCHTIGWSQSQVWGSLTSHLWTGEGKLSSHKVFSEENIEGQSSWQIWPVLVIWNVRFFSSD